MKIILIGFMGTGKTTVGKLLAANLGYDFLDTDDLIEAREGKTVSQIFATDGEAYFRKLEHKLARELSKADSLVIASGGGFALNRENMEVLRSNGLVVSLNASPEVIYQRVKHESHRPLLAVKNPLPQIEKLLSYRAKYYQEADLMVDTSRKEPGDIVKEILGELAGRGVFNGRNRN
ncbi:MAG: shikimate kinase [Bacillota bacterium]